MIVSGIDNDVVVTGRVYGDDAPLTIVRHFGDGGGYSIACVVALLLTLV